MSAHSRGSSSHGATTHGITIRDVTPRDGLQGERPLPPEIRVDIARKLSAAGLQHIEASAFVSPRAVPAMVGAAEIMQALLQDVSTVWWALVPNIRGAQLACDSGVTAVTVTLSASDTYSQRNVGRSTQQALAELPELVVACGPATVDLVLSCAFGSPYGDVDVALVLGIIDDIRAHTSAHITLADTTGAATPRRVRQVISGAGPGVGLHLHDTRGTALVNALTAVDLGVHRFDTAVGGLGGSPFADGAGGNLATEALVQVLDDGGIPTGVNLDDLLKVAEQLATQVGHRLPGRTAIAGPLPEFN